MGYIFKQKVDIFSYFSTKAYVVGTSNEYSQHMLLWRYKKIFIWILLSWSKPCKKFFCFFFILEPKHGKMYLRNCAPSKDRLSCMEAQLDQSLHCSLCIYSKVCKLLFFSCRQSRLIRLQDAQADLNFCCVHMWEGTFSHTVAPCKQFILFIHTGWSGHLRLDSWL